MLLGCQADFSTAAYGTGLSTLGSVTVAEYTVLGSLVLKHQNPDTESFLKMPLVKCIVASA